MYWPPAKSARRWRVTRVPLPPVVDHRQGAWAADGSAHHRPIGIVFGTYSGNELLIKLQTLLANVDPPSSSLQSRETMNQYFSVLDGIVQKRKVSNRIRFMIQDVVDLRKNNWKPRREDNNPKTIDQIHKDAIREREEQERELNNPQLYQGSMSGQPGRDNRGLPGDRRGGDRGDDRMRKQSRESINS